MSMIDKRELVQKEIKSIIEKEGVDLIDVKVYFTRSKFIVRCLVDYPSGGITIDKCVGINKKISFYLNETNVLGDTYEVEVNSPGLDRLLKNSKDFFRIKGKTVSLWLNEPVCGKEYLEGLILEVDEDKLVLDYRGETVNIYFSKIKTGKEKIN